jgi:hypothetical protein
MAENHTSPTSVCSSDGLERLAGEARDTLDAAMESVLEKVGEAANLVDGQRNLLGEEMVYWRGAARAAADVAAFYVERLVRQDPEGHGAGSGTAEAARRVWALRHEAEVVERSAVALQDRSAVVSLRPPRAKQRGGLMKSVSRPKPPGLHVAQESSPRSVNHQHTL